MPFDVPIALRRALLIREPLRRYAKRHAPAGPVRMAVDGLSFSLAPADNKTDFDIWYKRRLPEAEERAFLAAHLSAGDVFVDIGANIGLYTVALLAAVPGLSAVTFEPIARLRARQVLNLSLNRLTDRAEVRSEAIGPAGALTLYESGNAGRSSLVPFPGGRDVGLVAVRPLATLIDRASAIKIDVEGFEDQALLPYFAATSPAAWPKAIVIETLHRAVWRRDCLQELAASGYVVAGASEENALLVRRS